MSNLLVLKNITGGYPNHQVFSNLNLTVKQGDALAIVGENGVGKTTLLKAIIGLVRIEEGDKCFNGESILRFLPNEIAHKGVAYVPQTKNVFVELSISEHFKLLGLKKTEQIEMALAHFPDLLTKRHQRAQQLSGGQRQQLAIAFALAKKPKLLILDEPTANIQPSIIDKILTVLQLQHRKHGLTVLFSEQNITCRN